MSTSRFRDELAQSIEATLLEQARKNEITIAWVRAVTLSLVVASDFYAHFHPPAIIPSYPISIPALSTTYAALAIALLVALLRGFYRAYLRTLVPALDGMFIGAALLNLASSFPTAAFHEINASATMVAACALFAATGPLRLTRRAAVITSTISIAIFIGVTSLHDDFTVTTPIQVSLLVGIGLLSVWMTSVVRRAVQSEVGRSTFERFLPTKVVREAYAASDRSDNAEPLLTLLTEPRSVEATVIVTDLRGFTTLAESLAPAEALAFLNDIQGELATIVRDSGGTVDKFLGDGMLAVFGAPEALEDHAARALRAVLAMRARVAKLNEERTKTGGSAIQLGIGMHAGPVVAGCLGSGTRLEFTVIGDTVNTASRLEGLTKDKRVEALLSEDAVTRIPERERAAILGDHIQLTSIGPVAIRGRREPLVLYSLADARLTPSMIPPSSSAILS